MCVDKLVVILGVHVCRQVSAVLGVHMCVDSLVQVLGVHVCLQVNAGPWGICV